jgi:hypothetical protein
MRPIAIVVLTVMLATSAAAQVKRIAVVSPGPSIIDSMLRAQGIEEVDTFRELPDNLSEYEALFLTSSPDSSTQLRLTQYIENSGKLFVEAFPRVVDSTDASNPLWIRFGVKRMLYTEAIFDVRAIAGVYRFTSNIYDSLPVLAYQSGYGGPRGSIISIVEAEDGSLGFSQPIAYISEDTSLRMVVSIPNNYPGYYELFLRDVICDYFNLCPPSAAQTSTPHDPLLIRPIQGNNGNIQIGISSNQSEEVEILNVMGVVVERVHLGPGSHFIQFPTMLSSGVYFAKASGASTSITRFEVLHH